MENQLSFDFGILCDVANFCDLKTFWGFLVSCKKLNFYLRKFVYSKKKAIHSSRETWKYIMDWALNWVYFKNDKN